MQNGGCGFVLRPEFMFRDGYVPNDASKLTHVEPIHLAVRVIAARWLQRKSARGLVTPFVEVEICGTDYDNAKVRTKNINDNGFNPIWNEVPKD